MVPIRNKVEMYRLLRAGLLGNALRMANSLEGLRAQGYTGLVGLRVQSANGGSGFFDAWLSDKGARARLKQWSQFGVTEDQVVWCECSPTQGLLLQGEVLDDAPFPLLRYSRVQGISNRVAMSTNDFAAECSGSEAQRLLASALTPPALEDLYTLLEQYPGHVVEFSAFNRNLGWARGRNCVIWEVRQY